MKAKLVFNLPEDEQEHRDALNGTLWRGVFIELDNYLRNRIKNGHGYETTEAALESIRTILHEAMASRGVHPYE